MREERPSRTSFCRGMSMAVDGWMRKSRAPNRSASGGNDLPGDPGACCLVRTFEHSRHVADVAQ